MRGSGSVVDACGITLNGLSPAEHLLQNFDLQLMSESRQFLPNVLGHKRFDVHVASLESSFCEPSGFKGLLNVETKVGDALRIGRALEVD
jgi:hypothetical protein